MEHKKAERRTSKAREGARVIKDKVKAGAFDAVTQYTSITSFDSGNKQHAIAQMIQTGVINPLHGMGDAIHEAQGNGRAARNVREVRNLTMGIAMEGILERHNNKALKRLDENSEAPFSINSLVEANSIVINQGVAEGIFDKHAVKTTEAWDIKNSHHRIEAMQKIRSQSNRFVSKKYGIDLRKQNADQLKSIIEKAKAGGDKNLVIMAQNELGFRSLGKENRVFGSSMSHNKVRKILRSNTIEMNEAYRGWDDLHKYYKGMRLVIREGARFYGDVGRGTVKGAYNKE